MSDPKLRRWYYLSGQNEYFDRAETGIEDIYLGAANVSVGSICGFRERLARCPLCPPRTDIGGAARYVR
jgi:hypothetical protein